MRLTKEQKEYRRTMKKLKKEGKVRDKYGQIVEPEKFSIDWSAVVKVVISIVIVIALLERIGGLAFMSYFLYRGGDMYNEDIYDTQPYNTESNEYTAEDLEYTFAKCSPELVHGGSRIRGLYDGERGTKHSLFIGQVMTLFGAPDYMTDDYEDVFSTAVSAADKDGNTLYLFVYYGAGGPAIGGEVTEQSKKAADELARLIVSAEPTDYEWTGTYGDVGVTVRMGVKDGVPYYK